MPRSFFGSSTGDTWRVVVEYQEVDRYGKVRAYRHVYGPYATRAPATTIYNGQKSKMGARKNELGFELYTLDRQKATGWTSA